MNQLTNKIADVRSRMSRAKQLYLGLIGINECACEEVVQQLQLNSKPVWDSGRSWCLIKQSSPSYKYWGFGDFFIPKECCFEQSNLFPAGAPTRSFAAVPRCFAELSGQLWGTSLQFKSWMNQKSLFTVNIIYIKHQIRPWSLQNISCMLQLYPQPVTAWLRLQEKKAKTVTAAGEKALSDYKKVLESMKI